MKWNSLDGNNRSQTAISTCQLNSIKDTSLGGCCSCRVSHHLHTYMGPILGLSQCHLCRLGAQQDKALTRVCNLWVILWDQGCSVCITINSVGFGRLLSLVGLQLKLVLLLRNKVHTFRKMRRHEGALISVAGAVGLVLAFQLAPWSSTSFYPLPLIWLSVHYAGPWFDYVCCIGFVAKFSLVAHLWVKRLSLPPFMLWCI